MAKRTTQVDYSPVINAYLERQALAGLQEEPSIEDLRKKYYGAGPEGEGSGFLDSIGRGLASGSAGVLQGQAQLGNLMGIGDGATAQSLGNVLDNNQRKKQYSIGEMLPFASDYWTNPEGATYDVSNMIGSAGTLGTETALVVGGIGTIGSMLGIGTGTAGAGAGAGALARGASMGNRAIQGLAGSFAKAARKMGQEKLATTLESPLGAMFALNIAKTPLEVASEAGNAGAEALEGGATIDEARKQAAIVAALQMPLLAFSNTLESTGLGGAFVKEAGGKFALMDILGAVTQEGIQNFWEEGMQQSTHEYAQGKQSLLGVVNPMQWSDEALLEGAAGMVGGLAIGGGNAMASKVLGGKKEEAKPTDEKPNTTQEQAPKVKGTKPAQEEVIEAEVVKSAEEDVPPQEPIGSQTPPQNFEPVDDIERGSQAYKTLKDMLDKGENVILPDGVGGYVKYNGSDQRQKEQGYARLGNLANAQETESLIDAVQKNENLKKGQPPVPNKQPVTEQKVQIPKQEPQNFEWTEPNRNNILQNIKQKISESKNLQDAKNVLNDYRLRSMSDYGKNFDNEWFIKEGEKALREKYPEYKTRQEREAEAKQQAFEVKPQTVQPPSEVPQQGAKPQTVQSPSETPQQEVKPQVKTPPAQQTTTSTKASEQQPPVTKQNNANPKPQTPYNPHLNGYRADLNSIAINPDLTLEEKEAKFKEEDERFDFKFNLTEEQRETVKAEARKVAEEIERKKASKPEPNNNSEAKPKPEEKKEDAPKEKKSSGEKPKEEKKPLDTGAKKKNFVANLTKASKKFYDDLDKIAKDSSLSEDERFKKLEKIRDDARKRGFVEEKIADKCLEYAKGEVLANPKIKEEVLPEVKEDPILSEKERKEFKSKLLEKFRLGMSEKEKESALKEAFDEIDKLVEEGKLIEGQAKAMKTGGYGIEKLANKKIDIYYLVPNKVRDLEKASNTEIFEDPTLTDEEKRAWFERKLKLVESEEISRLQKKKIKVLKQFINICTKQEEGISNKSPINEDRLQEYNDYKKAHGLNAGKLDLSNDSEAAIQEGIMAGYGNGLRELSKTDADEMFSFGYDEVVDDAKLSTADAFASKGISIVDNPAEGTFDNSDIENESIRNENFAYAKELESRVEAGELTHGEADKIIIERDNSELSNVSQEADNKADNKKETAVKEPEESEKNDPTNVSSKQRYLRGEITEAQYLKNHGIENKGGSKSNIEVGQGYLESDIDAILKTPVRVTADEARELQKGDKKTDAKRLEEYQNSKKLKKIEDVLDVSWKILMNPLWLLKTRLNAYLKLGYSDLYVSKMTLTGLNDIARCVGLAKKVPIKVITPTDKEGKPLARAKYELVKEDIVWRVPNNPKRISLEEAKTKAEDYLTDQEEFFRKMIADGKLNMTIEHLEDMFGYFEGFVDDDFEHFKQKCKKTSIVTLDGNIIQAVDTTGEGINHSANNGFSQAQEDLSTFIKRRKSQLTPKQVQFKLNQKQAPTLSVEAVLDELKDAANLIANFFKDVKSGFANKNIKDKSDVIKGTSSELEKARKEQGDPKLKNIDMGFVDWVINSIDRADVKNTLGKLFKDDSVEFNYTQLKASIEALDAFLGKNYQYANFKNSVPVGIVRSKKAENFWSVDKNIYLNKHISNIATFLENMLSAYARENSNKALENNLNKADKGVSNLQAETNKKLFEQKRKEDLNKAIDAYIKKFPEIRDQVLDRVKKRSPNIPKFVLATVAGNLRYVVRMLIDSRFRNEQKAKSNALKEAVARTREKNASTVLEYAKAIKGRTIEFNKNNPNPVDIYTKAVQRVMESSRTSTDKRIRLVAAYNKLEGAFLRGNTNLKAEELLAYRAETASYISKVNADAGNKYWQSAPLPLAEDLYTQVNVSPNYEYEEGEKGRVQIRVADLSITADSVTRIDGNGYIWLPTPRRFTDSARIAFENAGLKLIKGNNPRFEGLLTYDAMIAINKITGYEFSKNALKTAKENEESNPKRVKVTDKGEELLNAMLVRLDDVRNTISNTKENREVLAEMGRKVLTKYYAILNSNAFDATGKIRAGFYTDIRSGLEAAKDRLDEVLESEDSLGDVNKKYNELIKRLDKAFAKGDIDGVSQENIRELLRAFADFSSTALASDDSLEVESIVSEIKPLQTMVERFTNSNFAEGLIGIKDISKDDVVAVRMALASNVYFGSGIKNLLTDRYLEWFEWRSRENINRSGIKQDAEGNVTIPEDIQSEYQKAGESLDEKKRKWEEERKKKAEKDGVEYKEEVDEVSEDVYEAKAKLERAQRRHKRILDEMARLRREAEAKEIEKYFNEEKDKLYEEYASMVDQRDITAIAEEAAKTVAATLGETFNEYDVFTPKTIKSYDWHAPTQTTQAPSSIVDKNAIAYTTSDGITHYSVSAANDVYVNQIEQKEAGKPSKNSGHSKGTEQTRRVRRIDGSFYQAPLRKFVKANEQEKALNDSLEQISNDANVSFYLDGEKIDGVEYLPRYHQKALQNILNGIKWFNKFFSGGKLSRFAPSHIKFELVTDSKDAGSFSTTHKGTIIQLRNTSKTPLKLNTFFHEYAGHYIMNMAAYSKLLPPAYKKEFLKVRDKASELIINAAKREAMHLPVEALDDLVSIKDEYLTANEYFARAIEQVLSIMYAKDAKKKLTTVDFYAAMKDNPLVAFARCLNDKEVKEFRSMLEPILAGEAYNNLLDVAPKFPGRLDFDYKAYRLDEFNGTFGAESDVGLTNDAAAEIVSKSILDLFKKKEIPENIVIKEAKKSEAYKNTQSGVFDEYLFSPHVLAEKYPWFKKLYEIFSQATRKQENRRELWLKQLEQAKESLITDKDETDFNQVILDGDALHKEFSEKELEKFGYSDGVITAYKKTRALLKNIQKELNNARRGVHVVEKQMTKSEIETYVKDKFTIGIAIKREGDNVFRHYNRNKFGLLVSRLKADDKYTVKLTLPQIDEKYEAEMSPYDFTNLQNNKYASITSSKKKLNSMGNVVYEVSYRLTVPEVGNIKGYFPHIFDVFFVQDDEGKTLGSGKTLNEAVKLAEELSKNTGKKLIIQPQLFDGTWNLPANMDNMSLDELSKALDNPMLKTNVTKKQKDEMIAKLATKMSLGDAQHLVEEWTKESSKNRYNARIRKREGAEGYNKEVLEILERYIMASSRYVALQPAKVDAVSYYEDKFGLAFESDVPSDMPLANVAKEYIRYNNGMPNAMEHMVNNWISGQKSWQKYIKAEYGDRPALVLANNVNAEIGKIKLGFFNVSSALINLTQLMNSYAFIGNKGMQQGYEAFRRLSKSNMASSKEKLSLGERKIAIRDLRILKETGVFDSVGLDTASGFTKRRASVADNEGTTTMSKLGYMYRDVTEKGMYFFKKSELATRYISTLGAYYFARSKGQSHDEAIKYARMVNIKANFDYGAADAGGVFRKMAGTGIGELMMLFKKYPIKELEMILEMTPYIGKGLTDEKARFWGMYFLFSGLLGFPAADWVDDVLEKLFGYKPSIMAKHHLLKTFGDNPLTRTALYGAPAGTLGVDVSSRAGMKDMIPDNDSLIGFMGGASLSTAQQMTNAIYNLVFNEGDAVNAIKAYSPALGHSMEAMRGYRTDSKGRVSYRYEGNERFWKFFGFRPVGDSMQSDKTSASYAIDKINKEKKKELIRKLSSKLDARKPFTKQDIEDMKKYNVTKKDVLKYNRDALLTSGERNKKYLKKSMKDEFEY